MRSVHGAMDTPHTEDMDVYFIANGTITNTYPYAGRPMVANCSFRVTGAKPEIWDPESGSISSVSLYDTFDGMTHVPLILPAKGSAFVVFRHGQSHSPAQVIRSISRNGKTLLRAGNQPAPRPAHTRCKRGHTEARRKR